MTLPAVFQTAFGCTLALSGLYLTCFLRFYPQRRIFRALFSFFKGSVSKKDGQEGISSFSASAAALAGTLGTGNIAGVAAALVSGGAGAIFWMWVSAFFGMALKYAEIFLSARLSREESDGPISYIQKAFPGGKLAILFAAGCTSASFGIGNLAQVNAAAESMYDACGFPRILTGVLIAAAVFLIYSGGKKQVASLAAWFVPLTGGVYLAAALWIILPRLSLLPGVFRMIVSDAFTPGAVGGGMVGFLTGRAFRCGIARGVFTNEAGLGSAPIIHSASCPSSPEEEGLWGVAEVTLDTLVMCTLTAAVILVTAPHSPGSDSISLTAEAFSSALGGWAKLFLAGASRLFAFSSILTWEWCGESALLFLCPNQTGIRIYHLLFLAACVLGSVLPVKAVLSISDLLNFYMCLPNLLAIFRLKGELKTKSPKSSAYKKQKLQIPFAE